jgi:Tol biopolymer transport system component
VSPDGRFLTYVYAKKGECNGHIAIANSDGTQARQITQGQTISDIKPSFSPDGNHIVFLRAHQLRQHGFGGDAWAEYDVYVVDRDGKNLTRLTNQGFYSLDSPRFLTNQEVIFTDFAGDSGQNGTIYLVSLKTKKVAPWYSPPAKQHSVHVSTLSLSKDGKQVAFGGDTQTVAIYDINLVDVNTKHTNLLGATKYSSLNHCPVYDRAGSSIYYLGHDLKNTRRKGVWYDLWRADSATKRVVKIADGATFNR